MEAMESAMDISMLPHESEWTHEMLSTLSREDLRSLLDQYGGWPRNTEINVTSAVQVILDRVNQKLIRNARRQLSVSELRNLPMEDLTDVLVDAIKSDEYEDSYNQDVIDRVLQAGWNNTGEESDYVIGVALRYGSDTAMIKRLIETIPREYMKNTRWIGNIICDLHTDDNPDAVEILTSIRDHNYKYEDQNYFHMYYNYDNFLDIAQIIFSRSPDGELWVPDRLRIASLPTIARRLRDEEAIIGRDVIMTPFAIHNSRQARNLIIQVLQEGYHHEHDSILKFLKEYPEYEIYYEPLERSSAP